VHVQPTVYGGRYFDPTSDVAHYIPVPVIMPGYGPSKSSRRPNRKLPRRPGLLPVWSAQSTPQPEQPAVPFYPLADYRRAANRMTHAAGFSAPKTRKFPH